MVLDYLDRISGVQRLDADPHLIRRHRIVTGIAVFALISSLIALGAASLQSTSPVSLVLGVSVLGATFAAIAAARTGRTELAGTILCGTVLGAQIASGFFRDGFFITVSPGAIGGLMMAGYLTGPRITKRFVLALALGIAAVFVAHATGHVIAFDISPGDGRTMFALNALLTLPAVWYFQRLDRQAKEAADQRLMQNLKELQAAKDRLAQSDKLAAVGQLAAGVAHELNNPLAVILGFAQGLQRRLDDRPDLALPLTSIVRESFRCRDLVGELLTFSRAQKRTIEEFDLNVALRSVAALVEPRAKVQGVTLHTELAVEVLAYTGSRMQLEQVVLNLANNAIDAMEHGGSLTLRTARSGGEVSIQVEDTGSGIAPELRDRIFEPFFTTKPVGKGTGLGLSISWEIIRQHGGTIDLVSELGRGTTMSVRLPPAAGAPRALV
ncbi:MAG: hypothetical protein IPJ65_09995 [Archangiaceae bacterium]|nr:hypothetical protein [Archangiaceae bacterium]